MTVFWSHACCAAHDKPSLTSNAQRLALGLSHCWLEYGTTTDQRIKDAINKWVPDADNVLVVLNEPGFGAAAATAARTSRSASHGTPSRTNLATASAASRMSTPIRANEADSILRITTA